MAHQFTTVTLKVVVGGLVLVKLCHPCLPNNGSVSPQPGGSWSFLKT